MADRPRDDVAIAVQESVALSLRVQNARDIPGNGWLFGQNGDIGLCRTHRAHHNGCGSNQVNWQDSAKRRIAIGTAVQTDHQIEEIAGAVDASARYARLLPKTHI